MFELDCWQHKRNVWFGAVIAHLSKYLTELMADDLNSFPSVLRMSTDIEDLLRCIEKMLGGTAQYAKGCGAMFTEWMLRFHIGVYLYPIVRALGGLRQDMGIEGLPEVLMNFKYYFEFLNWRLSSGTSKDKILIRKLYITLQSTEMVALLRVLSILHISICLPTRWLAGKTEDLADHDFGYFDMGRVLDLMEDAFIKIADDGELFLDEEFMMNIFSPLAERVNHSKSFLITYLKNRRGSRWADAVKRATMMVVLGTWTLK